MPRILIVEDESILRRNMVDRLRAEGHELFDTATAESAEQLSALLAPDLLLTDLRLPGMDGLELLRRVRAASPRTLVILMTAHGSRQAAIDAIRDGAYDYLTKPVGMRELALLVQRACNHARAIDRVNCAARLQREGGAIDRFVGISTSARAVRKEIADIATSPAMAQLNPPPIMLTGETGVGKSLVARILHNEGPRKSAPFVMVHCGAMTPAEFATRYLGRTDPVANRQSDSLHTEKGILELADGGTVFLDEVSALPLDVQDMLLHLLEGHSIQTGDGRIGRKVNLQFIAASSRDLRSLANAGRFRTELFHRLCVLRMTLPPLRERADDIPVLAQHLLKENTCRLGVEAKSLTAEAFADLCRYTWPGNVRELAAVIEQAILRSSGRELRADDLSLPAVTSLDATDQSNRVDAPCTSIPGVPESPADARIRISFQVGEFSLAEVCARIVQLTHQLTNGDEQQTAKLLGLTAEEASERLDHAAQHAIIAARNEF